MGSAQINSICGMRLKFKKKKKKIHYFLKNQGYSAVLTKKVNVNLVILKIVHFFIKFYT